MKIALALYGLLHGVLGLLFAAVSVLLLVIAATTAVGAVSGGLGIDAAQELIQVIGIAAVAVVALQISQTIVEEEVVREAHVSGPTRVRRFLSRFLVVVVVALAIEGLIATFKALREEPSQLPYAAAVIAAVALLLAGWGWFVRCNRDAEELEPEAMREAKSEDHKLRK